MSITWDEFLEDIKSFVKRSDAIGDGWFLKQLKEQDGWQYLCKRDTISTDSCYLTDNGADFNNACLEFEDDQLKADHEASLDTPVKSTFTVDYHIIYSFSYSVPVLYFDAFKSNGELLSLDELWNVLPHPSYKENLNFDPWSTLTQTEHPLLQQPYFMIHPCGTNNFMAKCRRRNFVVTWLSCIGPMAGLTLSNNYAILCS